MPTSCYTVDECPATYQPWGVVEPEANGPVAQKGLPNHQEPDRWEWPLSRKLTTSAPPASDSTLIPIFEVLRRLKEKGVRIPEVPSIETYFGRYPELLPVVEGMTQRAFEIFKGGIQLSLEIIRDREYDDHYAALLVRSERYPKGIMGRLNGINAAFSEERTRSEGWFYLTTDFQKPR